MSWITIPANPNWEYDTTPPDPGAALSTHWAKSVNGIRTTTTGAEIYVNCRHKPLNPTQSSIPNEISKTFWDAVFDKDGNYVQAGRVMDFADVGAFTLVDKSPEKNTAYLYTGRYASTNGSSDSIQFGQIALSEPVLQVRATVRSSSNTSVNLGVASGTLTANSTWQEIGVNTPVVDYGDAQWFNGVDSNVTIGNLGEYLDRFKVIFYTPVVINSASNGRGLLYSTNVALNTGSTTGVVSNEVITMQDNTSSGRTSVTSITIGVGFHTVEFIWNGSSQYNIILDNVQQTTTSGAGHCPRLLMNDVKLGTRGSFSEWNGVLLDFEINETHGYTGRGATPWKDTIGTNDGTPSGAFQTVREYFTSPNYTLGALFAGDISDVRLYGAAGKLLHRAQLNDSSAGNLDTMPALDSSGNRKNGVYSGCAGATGEGIDPEVAGIVGYDNTMWFDGVNNTVSVPEISFGTANFKITCQMIALDGAYSICSNNNGNRLSLSIQKRDDEGTDSFQVRDVDGNFYTINTTQRLLPTNGELVSFEIERPDSTRISVSVNGTNYTDKITIPSTFSGSLGTIGQTTPVVKLNGIFTSLDVYDSSNTNVLSWDGSQEDAISQGWTVNGSPATVGQKRATILQTAGMNWNKVFRNIPTDIYSSGEFTTSSDLGWGTSNCTSLPNVDDSADATNLPIGDNWLRITAGDRISINNNSIVEDAIIAGGGGDYTISFDYHAKQNLTNFRSIAFTSAGNPQTSNVDLAAGVGVYSIVLSLTSAQASGLADFRIGSTNDHITGDVLYVKNIVITKANDIPFTQLVPASDANDQIDALGNAIIEPRLNNEQINLFGDGEYALTPNSASLDVTTEATWELWGNFYDTHDSNTSIFSKYDFATGNNRSWQILKNPSANAGEIDIVLGDASGLFGCTVFWAGLTNSVGCLSITYDSGTFVAYWNKVSLGAGVIRTGTIPTSLFVSEADVILGSNSNLSDFYDKKIGSAKFYSTALTANARLENYNERKALYGL
jgi:hypothetical protein